MHGQPRELLAKAKHRTNDRSKHPFAYLGVLLSHSKGFINFQQLGKFASLVYFSWTPFTGFPVFPSSAFLFCCFPTRPETRLPAPFSAQVTAMCVHLSVYSQKVHLRHCARNKPLFFTEQPLRHFVTVMKNRPVQFRFQVSLSGFMLEGIRPLREGWKGHQESTHLWQTKAAQRMRDDREIKRAGGLLECPSKASPERWPWPSEETSPLRRVVSQGEQTVWQLWWTRFQWQQGLLCWTGGSELAC